VTDIPNAGTLQGSGALGMAFDDILGGGAIALSQDGLALSTGTALDAVNAIEVLPLVAALELVHNGLEGGFLLVSNRAEDAGLFRFWSKLLVNVGIKLLKDRVFALHKGISKLACDSERKRRGEEGEVSVGGSLVGLVTVGM
jgi:hypothetical protein